MGNAVANAAGRIAIAIGAGASSEAIGRGAFNAVRSIGSAVGGAAGSTFSALGGLFGLLTLADSVYEPIDPFENLKAAEAALGRGDVAEANRQLRVFDERAAGVVQNARLSNRQDAGGRSVRNILKPSFSLRDTEAVARRSALESAVRDAARTPSIARLRRSRRNLRADVPGGGELIVDRPIADRREIDVTRQLSSQFSGISGRDVLSTVDVAGKIGAFESTAFLPVGSITPIEQKRQLLSSEPLKLRPSVLTQSEVESVFQSIAQDDASKLLLNRTAAQRERTRALRSGITIRPPAPPAQRAAESLPEENSMGLDGLVDSFTGIAKALTPLGQTAIEVFGPQRTPNFSPYSQIQPYPTPSQAAAMTGTSLIGTPVSTLPQGTPAFLGLDAPFVDFAPQGAGSVFEPFRTTAGGRQVAKPYMAVRSNGREEWFIPAGKPKTWSKASVKKRRCPSRCTTTRRRRRGSR